MPPTPDDTHPLDPADEPGLADLADGDIEGLVGEWLTVPDLCKRWGVSPTHVRRLIAEREVLAWRVGPRRVLGIPAMFVADDGPRHDIKGTLTLLADGGMRDPEILRWLFTADETLPVAGAPMDALAAGYKTEVRRRAQLEAM